MSTSKPDGFMGRPAVSHKYSLPAARVYTPWTTSRDETYVWMKCFRDNLRTACGWVIGRSMCNFASKCTLSQTKEFWLPGRLIGISGVGVLVGGANFCGTHGDGSHACSTTSPRPNNSKTIWLQEVNEMDKVINEMVEWKGECWKLKWESRMENQFGSNYVGCAQHGCPCPWLTVTCLVLPVWLGGMCTVSCCRTLDTHQRLSTWIDLQPPGLPQSWPR
jgi:hypothetical protein